MNLDYMSIDQYFECKSKLIGKIATYDILINSMEQSILKATVSGHLIQYEMDDGQMKVRAQYRNIDDMTKAMNGLIKIRQMYVNQASGRSIRLIGGGL
jgi:hypothetical protein